MNEEKASVAHGWSAVLALIDVGKFKRMGKITRTLKECLRRSKVVVVMQAWQTGQRSKEGIVVKPWQKW